MMKNASITIRTDTEFKKQCDTLFQKMGMTTATAISTFLHQAVMERGMPFTPSIKESTESIIEHLPEAGYVGKKGTYILPAGWNNAEDDVYESLV